MFRVHSVALFLVCLMVSSVAQDCNSSHMEYFHTYSLGKQDELNRTFTLVQQKFPAVPDLKYSEGGNNYVIKVDGTPTFYYLDSNQKAEVTGGDTVIIEGGKVQITLDFHWAKTGTATVEGTGSANGLSQEIIFAKGAVINDFKFLVFNLTHYDPIIFQNSFILTRYSPANTSAHDLEVLKAMMNNMTSHVDERSWIQEQTNSLYGYYLNASLHDDKHSTTPDFTYTWTDKVKGNLTLNYTNTPTKVDLERAGLTLVYSMGIKDFKDFSCNDSLNVPESPLDADYYGGIQEFISFNVFTNSIKVALQNKFFDTYLSATTWSSSMFQFAAGDLYEVLPKVRDIFYASQPVTGNCVASPSPFIVQKGTYSHINVTLGHDCELNIGREKVLNFRVETVFKVRGEAQPSSLNFIVEAAEAKNVYLMEYNSYKIANAELGTLLVRTSLKMIHNQMAFGSGWKLYTRDYPNFEVH